MKAANVYKQAKIEEDSIYLIVRSGVRTSVKCIGTDIEEVRAKIEKMAKKDHRLGSFARYEIINGYCQTIETYYTVDLEVE